MNAIWSVGMPMPRKELRSSPRTSQSGVPYRWALGRSRLPPLPLCLLVFLLLSPLQQPQPSLLLLCQGNRLPLLGPHVLQSDWVTGGRQAGSRSGRWQVRHRSVRGIC